jgi:pSer/pThr/pTyr-binding forkhead associated (FHA) protein
MASENKKPFDETQQIPNIFVHPKARPGTNLLHQEVPWAIEFQVIGTNERIQVAVRSAITIGRSDSERGVKPDVDLTPHGGYQKGVSRRHAIITPQDNRLVIRALNTTNGTWVNGIQVAAGEESRLRHGDELTIGSLQMNVVFLTSPATE